MKTRILVALIAIAAITLSFSFKSIKSHVPASDEQSTAADSTPAGGFVIEEAIAR
jgi:hypothetical protein